ncbi:MAG: ribonuclease P protein component [Gemmatimonadaceae bacterium]|nr:ribonuclease P protein component [Gemmatimonadaceae bacterium]
MERVRREGKRVRSAHFELRVAASPLSYARAGFIVPKHGHEIVDRNRLKRRLRELVRVLALPALRPQDVVVRVLPGAYRLTWAQVQAEVTTLLRRLDTQPVPAAAAQARD